MAKNAAAKLVTVSSTGQISIGKAWAGRKVLVEPVSENELRISEGMIIPKHQAIFYTPEALGRLEEFNKWEEANPPLTNTDSTKLREEIEALRKKRKK